MELKICHLYSDILNLYGDQGNIICLRERAKKRGIDVAITKAPLGFAVDFTAYDLFFIGGGQDFEQELLLADLQKGKGQDIRAAIEDGKVFLTICGGLQLLGHYYKTWDGKQYDFIGALDFYTEGIQQRMVGNAMMEWDEVEPNYQVVGFENHSGKTWLGSNVRPFGKVVKGFGNNGEDQAEGIRYKNVYGTYFHGPLLPKNPVLADAILKTALLRNHPNIELEQLDDAFENSAHDYMVNRLKNEVGKRK